MNGSRAPFAYQQPIRCEFEKFSCCINLHFSRLNISTLVQNIYTLHKIFPHITKYLHSDQIFPLCTKNSTPEQNISTIVYKIFQLCTTKKFFFTAKIVDIGDFFSFKTLCNDLLSFLAKFNGNGQMKLTLPLPFQ